MAEARRQHPNAVLTPRSRRRMVASVIEQGWTIEATADRFQVDAKTVRKWRDRYLAEGDAGLADRSSRPHHSPRRTKAHLRRRVLHLRRKNRWGADHIGHDVGLAVSTVAGILRAEGLGRLDRGDRATAGPILHYQRERPGELIHVDVKKIGAIPDGGGWRLHGRAGDTRRRVLGPRRRLVRRARRVLRARDHRQRVLLPLGTLARGLGRHRDRGEKDAPEAAANERQGRALPPDPARGVGLHPVWTSEAQRHHDYRRFTHFYDHHRFHGPLNWATPAATLAHLRGENLPARHN
jgi:transposase-like protein